MHRARNHARLGQGQAQGLLGRFPGHLDPLQSGADAARAVGLKQIHPRFQAHGKESGPVADAQGRIMRRLRVTPRHHGAGHRRVHAADHHLTAHGYPAMHCYPYVRRTRCYLRQRFLRVQGMFELERRHGACWNAGDCYSSRGVRHGQRHVESG